ncbi:MAG: tetraacyldisaccharide 4'-kinase [Anaerobiospirillum sp.]|nr:tetraacyldisaccharide 4'-kinase [Anaerobiospirillum sp.]
MSFLNNLWYGKTLSAYLLQLPLLPFSGIFAVIAAARRSFYANGLCHKTGPVVPVVVVGGLTVGGTGKTPICIALAQELRSRGFKPGILTRGYKSNCPSFPCQVPLSGTPEVYGDEPCLMRRATKVPVVIDPKRSRGADYLAGLGVDVIITDDGLQHYALDRDVEICVLDGARMLGNGHLLPAGPLREAKWRLKTVDCIVVSGAVAHLGHYPMRYKQTSITPLNEESHEVLEPQSKVCALAGIGNPDRFFKTLEDCGYVVAQKVELGDHGRISMDKLKKLAQTKPVIMTAKDAIKYQAEAKDDNLNNIFVLNITAQLSKQFYDDVVNKIKQANYKVAQRRKQREAKGYTLTPIEPVDVIEPLEVSAPQPTAASAEPVSPPVAAAAPAGAAADVPEAQTTSTIPEDIQPDEVSSGAEAAPSSEPSAAPEEAVEAAESAPSADEAEAKPTRAKRSKSLKKSRKDAATDSEAPADSESDDGHDIFALKKQRSHDPTQLPRELKRKRTTSGQN